MDLKEYAVLAKLNTNSDLLSKVMKGDALSIDQVSHYFAPLLAPVPADGIDKLISDYPSYLASHTKLALEQLEGHQVKIDGEIDDRTLEVVKLLSGDDTKTIIENVIKANFENFSSSEVTVDAIQTSESTEVTKPVIGPKTLEEFEKEQEAEKNAQAAFTKTKPAPSVDASVKINKTEAEEKTETEEAKTKAEEAKAKKTEAEESLDDELPDDVPDLTDEDLANITNVGDDKENKAENSETDETGKEADEEAKAKSETKTEDKTETKAKTKAENKANEADKKTDELTKELTEAQAKAKQNRENADYDMRLAEKIKEAMKFLLDQLEENDLDKKLPGLNLKGLENPQAELAMH